MATEFIDKARISVSAGKGGNGAVAFHREKYIAAGGPDGGDGGNGGDIILQVDDNMSTLMDFRYKRKYTAENGMDGQGSRKFGKSGKPLTIRVPRGTLVRDAETNEIIQDMSSSEPYVLCRGGKGGWGNAHFATPTRQAPRFAKSGLEGEEHDVVLELKLLADVGLIGFPNVGKSTLLSVVSKARPKIANYHFTTLYPNLGVVYVDEGVSFVMADIPGIIECRQYHIVLLLLQRQPAAFSASLCWRVSPLIQSHEPQSSTVSPGSPSNTSRISRNSSAVSVVWWYSSAWALCWRLSCSNSASCSALISCMISVLPPMSGWHFRARRR